MASKALILDANILIRALALDCPIWTEDTDFFGCGVATWTLWKHRQLPLAVVDRPPRSPKRGGLNVTDWYRGGLYESDHLERNSLAAPTLENIDGDH